MTSQRGSLALRIAARSAIVLGSVSAIALVAIWSVLTSVTSASVVVDPPEPASGPQAIEAVLQFSSKITGTILAISAVSLVLLVAVGTLISYRAAQSSLSRVESISTHTRRITSNTLNERLALSGPPDEIKNLADTIDETLTKLEEAFSQQERFAANASHELRTPLTVLRTTIESIQRDSLPAQKDDVDRLMRNALKMEATIDALMLLAQSKALPEERKHLLDLSATLEVVVEELSPKLASRGVFYSVVAEPCVHTLGDQVLLLRAVHNLVENAALYTPPGGTAVFAVRRDGGFSELVVTNSGPRIEAQVAAQLTEPFNRGSDSRLQTFRGTGLGLSIVQAVAHQHGGRLSIEANADGGIRAILRLPNSEKVGDQPSVDPRPFEQRPAT
ncbi:sensor histidine kinase [Leucobacter chromiireducens]|nr:HAMP domain-containing sensor histidine kinase [Leucobacter chromiireducens]